MTRDELVTNVQTIVIVMMENRSFDNVLGHLRHPDGANRPEVEGIEDLKNPRYQNPSGDGVAVAPFWMDDAPLTSDLPHDKDAVQTQLAFAPVAQTYEMNGFVRAFETELHTSIDTPPVMGILKGADLPTTSALAAQYTVCDHWFACLPTSTAPNRLMSMCGYTEIDDTGTLLPEQTTVYDWLSARGVRWRVYHAGIPFLSLMPRLAPLLLSSHFRALADLETDVTSEPADQWPQVIFIEPDYYNCPIHLSAPCATPCDNHAPVAMAPGEEFLRLVYAWLTSNPASWARTALVVTYDEHGGFFDHVAPPALPYRNGAVAFDSAGVRVPAIVAGPFAPRGVCKTPLDNTSVLQMLAERFGKPAEAYSASVASRAGTFGSVTSVLSASAANDAVSTIPRYGSGSSSAPRGAGSQKLEAAFTVALKAMVTRYKQDALAKFPGLKDL